MRRQLGQALIAGLILTMLLTSSVSADSKQDKLVGSGKFTYFTIAEYHVTVSAHSGPAGEDPRRQVKFTGEGRQFKGEVICLAVSGNQARTVAILDKLIFPFPGAISSFIVLSVIENGTPGSSPDDEVSLLYGTTSIPLSPSFTDCSFDVFNPYEAVVQGNFVITDAMP